MKTARILTMLIFLATGCGNAFTSTIVRTSGDPIEAMPRCFTPAADGGQILRGDGLGDGIAASNVDEIRSHAGVESFVIGSAAVLIGSAMIGWYLADDPRSETTWRVATGGATAGIGLISVIVGSLFWSQSANALSTRCSPRGSIPR
jgi:hypothetical protein